MKMVKELKRKVKSSNRLLYTLITLGILIITIGGIYAVVPNPGHTSGEIDFKDGLAIYPGGSGAYFFVESNNGGADYLQIGNYNNGFKPLLLDANPLILQQRSGGNVGIGTTSPTEKLQVNGNIKATGFLYSSSDKSLKTNIQSLQNSLEKVKQLNGVSFNWKANGEQSIGLIAQDVEKVFPELVSGEEGNKAVAYGNLVAVLIEAMKEQQKQIDELKSKCN